MPVTYPDFSGFAAQRPKAVPAPLTTSQIADAVTDGILQAFREIGRAVSLTDGERNLLEAHRASQQIARQAAKDLVRDATRPRANGGPIGEGHGDILANLQTCTSGLTPVQMSQLRASDVFAALNEGRDDATR